MWLDGIHGRRRPGSNSVTINRERRLKSPRSGGAKVRVDRGKHGRGLDGGVSKAGAELSQDGIFEQQRGRVEVVAEATEGSGVAPATAVAVAARRAGHSARWVARARSRVAGLLRRAKISLAGAAGSGAPRVRDS